MLVCIILYSLLGLWAGEVLLFFCSISGNIQPLMKNIELYKTIEALVQAKKQQYTPNKPLFGQQYCKQQIQKRKLIPFNPRSKMSRLMKNFHRLDTYVDVEQLFEYINMKINQKKKEDDKIHHPNIKWKSKQQIVFSEEEIINKVREKLGPYNSKIFAKENQSMSDLIQFLEKESLVGTSRKQNAPSCDDLNFYVKNTKEKQDNSSKYSTQKEKWRYFEGSNYCFDDQTQRKPLRTQIDKPVTQKSSIKQRQQKMQLIHQVSTYLQIILQNHHKQKWGSKIRKMSQKQNIMSQSASVMVTATSTPTPEPSASSTLNEQLFKKVSFQTPRISTRHTEYKSSFQRSQLTSQKSSTDNSPICALKKMNSLNSSGTNFNPRQTAYNSDINNYIAKKVGVKQNFTFRNRGVKDNLMKKIQAFLEFVQNQEKIFKKQKHCSINQLNSIQNKQKINNGGLGGKNLFVDDHQIKAVQNIVHMQK